MIFDEARLGDLIAQCRLEEAAALLTLAKDESSSAAAQVRRMRAAIYALAGDERSFARLVESELLACDSGAVTKYLAASTQPDSLDHLIAALPLAWSNESQEAYDALRRAHDLALSEGRFAVAVAARERLAHHALLFGDLELARGALGEAVRLAETHGFSNWLLRCLAAAARLALDAGDLERAEQLLDRSGAARLPDELALFAATGVQLAVERGDDAALRAWTSPALLEVALHSELLASAVGATIAALIANGAPQPDSPVALALRRALLQAESIENTPELFSMAARYGDLVETEFGAHALAAVFAPDRPYLKAHKLLARAYLLFRSGERAGWIDCAGDAARAFSAMGLRRWTNEAMLLLVVQEPAAERRPRGRSRDSALTGREQQVAYLIRRGARNREVAAALQISEHTVERHVSSILGRLGLRSRWQIADPKRIDGSETAPPSSSIDNQGHFPSESKS
jgi:DNA-binding CsgD family transcriptional regulator